MKVFFGVAFFVKMEKPRISELWLLPLIVLLSAPITYSAAESQLSEESVLCNELYECPEGLHSPFTPGNNYFYSFHVNSTLRIEKVVNKKLHDDEQETTKTISQDGWIALSPVSACEIGIIHRESAEPSWKIVFYNRTIHRICASIPNPDPKTNMLKALVSLFQVNAPSRIDLPAGFTIENDSKGNCVTKLLQCPGSKNKYVKFKSTRLCSLKNDETIGHDLQHKMDEFDTLVNELSSNNRLCELPSNTSPEELDHPLGIAICIIEKNGDGLITSSSCAEEEDAMELSPMPIVQGRYYGSISLKLGEIMPAEVPNKVVVPTSYYQTNLHQVDIGSDNAGAPDAKSAENGHDGFVPRLEALLHNLSNSTKRMRLKSQDIQKTIEEFQQLIRVDSTSDNLVKYLEEQINSSASEKSINFFLSILTLEASKESVLGFWSTILANNLLKNHISDSDLEYQIQKLLNTLSYIHPTVKMINFCKFIVDYVEHGGNDVSNSIKVVAFMTFTELLNQFCNQMQEKNGESFCINNEIIQDWMNSTILRNIEDPSSYEQILRLESLTNVKQHVNDVCQHVYDLRKADAVGLWTLINCYRNEPCNTSSKNFFRKLLQDKTTRSNAKIAAFLPMTKCFDDGDQALVRKIFNERDPQNNELLNFIAQYKGNRDFYGRTQEALLNGVPDEFESALRTGRSSYQSPKITKGSNTFAIIKIPTLPVQLSLETNMLYFDKPVMIPELVILKLGAVTPGSADDKTMLEVQFYVTPSKSQSVLNYLVTIVVRKFGRTTHLKENCPMSEEKLYELYQLIESKAAEISQLKVSGESAMGKLFEIIRKSANLDIFKVMALPSRRKYIPTITGIPQRMRWDANGFMGLTVDKQDCSNVMDDNVNDNICQLQFNPVFNLDTSLSLGIGYPEATHFRQEGFLFQSNLSLELPLSLHLIRNASNKENLLELVIPSLRRALVKGGLQVLSMEASSDSIAEWNYKMSLGGIYGPSSCPFSTDSDSNTMKIVLSNNMEQKTLSLKMTDLQHEAMVELKQDPLYSIHGNFTYLSAASSKPFRHCSFEVGVKNSDDVKQLQTRVTKGEDEYSLDVYYNKKLQKAEEATYRGWGCRAQTATGILCKWPFCMFCGEEYFLGATFSTPRWKNIKLLEGSVTQVFPDERMDIVVITSGIHRWHNAHFKASVTRAENSSLIHSPSLREQVNLKILEHKLNETMESGDTDADSDPGPPSSFYSFSSEIYTELFGASGGVSGVLVNSRGAPKNLGLYGGELVYAFDQLQSASFLTTIYDLNVNHDPNVTRSNVAETTFRSTEFPTMDFDSKIHSQTSKLNAVKVLYAIHLINLAKGAFQLETLNNVNFNEVDATKSWENFHIDRTYKLYLPELQLPRIFKGRIVVERVENVLHEAALEVLIGLENGIDIRFDFIPDEDNALEILTSVSFKGETYGLHHRLEPVQDLPVISSGDADTVHLESQKFKYKGTYILGDRSMKAAGIFVARNDREILPFSKFDIRVSSIDGTDLGIRIFGAETIQPENNIHNIKMNILKGETNIFEFENEINPLDDKVPIKGTIYLKDYGEAKIFDNTKVANKRNLQVKVKWPSKKRLITGRISFPTSIQDPLYLDLDALVVNEVNEESVMKLTSRSSIGFHSFQEKLKNFSVSTKNVMELKNQKWELGLEGAYLNENLDFNANTIKGFYTNDNYTLLTYYVPPELNRYFVDIQHQHYVSRRKRFRNFFLKAERPNVTPLHLQLYVENGEGFKTHVSFDDNDAEIESSSTDRMNRVSRLKVCHKDNFLYIFPMLTVDFSLENLIQHERNFTKYHSKLNQLIHNGKISCSSSGIQLPLIFRYLICNGLNINYKYSSEHIDYYGGPWIANMTVLNHNENDLIDMLDVKLRANYDKLREKRDSSQNDYYGDINMVLNMLSTVHGDDLLKHSYNLEYNLERKSADSSENFQSKAINGSYGFTRMFESLDFFEFSDQHQWSQLDSGNLYIWTNLLNHTTDAYQTSESATFSSQYVSLGEGESSNNVTWLQLRSSLDSNGFGLLQNIILQPTTLLNAYEGTVNADLLIKTEFSPVKTFRVLLSHDHNKSENEDDESSKYDTLSKLNLILNEREVSCTNSLTAAEGKTIGVGNTFMAQCRTVDDIYDCVTIKTFLVCPKNLMDTSQDNLIHVDVSSSWTNADDDDIDLRISNDFIYGPTTNGVPMVRLAYSENSTDLDVERNGSIFIYQNVANKEMIKELRLTDTVISDSLDVLSFTQTSLQGTSQQIIDDYFNITNLNDVQTSDSESRRVWVDYNLDTHSNTVIQGNSSNSRFNLKWFGFEEQLYHCQSLYRICADNGTQSSDYQIDTSNYCNLAVLPVKHVIYGLV